VDYPASPFPFFFASPGTWPEAFHRSLAPSTTVEQPVTLWPGAAPLRADPSQGRGRCRHTDPVLRQCAVCGWTDSTWKHARDDTQMHRGAMKMGINRLLE